MVDTTGFRNAMALLGGAVSVITTDGPAGRFGFTASAVCSVTDSPPTLLVWYSPTATGPCNSGLTAPPGTLCKAGRRCWTRRW
jgi:hypothetical protein